MKTIIVTGSVGTGKTGLSKKISKKLNFQYLDVNEIIKKYNIPEGYDKKRKSKIIDVSKLNKALIKEISNFKRIIKNNKQIPIKNSKIKNDKKIKNGIIIDSHLSHYLPTKYVDLCIVAKCNLKVLEKRLKKRKYSVKKIRENLDAEIFDVCLNEAKENNHEVIVLDTSKGIKTTINSLLQEIKALK
ncbi:MAG: adenylate kinase family protein [Candidatus Woesearchaeota archaeon]|jgi:adenylate kinase|nr:adenylate kinase family protein [Candidatus Woesearchaeota archaeon]MDP7623046.1 adenylate kinase family protein [Candidatus Woesearchaeota archaeon]HJN56726.1 adenylate kinase family protein [Candidatus Woesearchaeota archaeon]|tara:strand:- start:12131 stop:12691 length:561 start_codon:yes stop_codon:yes gene_type:complete